eukprot:TRINITY_DN6473_c0_g1_i1.p1 TRINITY_DN6473_c0_g1~~TRINITY_DN6473_c0_g1_i1.p1  ORF type:complete len:116 (-),score=6.38 TRINITY_DN6473_c0_g1_i1:439-786(-)
MTYATETSVPTKDIQPNAKNIEPNSDLVSFSNRGMYIALMFSIVGLFVCKSLNIGMILTISVKTAFQWIGFVALIWLGMVLAISFMESWVKFTAKTITRTAGKYSPVVLLGGTAG